MAGRKTVLPSFCVSCRALMIFWFGISRQARQRVHDFDEIISTSDADFGSSGLVDTSLIRLGFLALLPASEFLGDIGSISPERHRRLLRRLASYLQESASEPTVG